MQPSLARGIENDLKQVTKEHCKDVNCRQMHAGDNPSRTRCECGHIGTVSLSDRCHSSMGTPTQPFWAVDYSVATTSTLYPCSLDKQDNSNSLGVPVLVAGQTHGGNPKEIALVHANSDNTMPPFTCGCCCAFLQQSTYPSYCMGTTMCNNPEEMIAPTPYILSMKDTTLF